MKSTLILLLCVCCSLSMFAQKMTVQGTVKDQDGLAIIGANVVEKGTTKGTVTDVNGHFTLSTNEGTVLHVSFIGLEAKEVSATPNMTITLSPSSENMEEVIVTALGVEKKKGTIGYAAQEVDATELVKARDASAIGGLTGKVAGLTIGASTELLSAPSVSLRGREGVLYVVDGVPISSDSWNISADDIQSYTVLKGPTAAALYGFRGQNGAIMITTKRAEKGTLTIEVNSSTMFEPSLMTIPESQNEYGPGSLGEYEFGDGKGGGTNDADYDVWGPALNGQLIKQYDSPIDPVTGERTPTPFTARGANNLDAFIQTGMLTTNNVAMSSANETHDFRFSASHTYQKGIIPETKLNIYNLNLSGGANVSSKVRVEGSFNFNRQTSPNFPDAQYGPQSLIYLLSLWTGADWSVNDVKAYWKEGKEGIEQNFVEMQQYNNPWLVVNEWERGHYKNDFNGYGAIGVNLADNLHMKLRTQVTGYDMLRNEKMPWGVHAYGMPKREGNYREDKRSLFENNTDLMFNYNTSLGGVIDLNALVGGNMRIFQYNSSYTSTDLLSVPDLYTFSNSQNPIHASNFRSDMRVNSAYSMVDLSWQGMVNLSLTGRWDQLSTLPSDNNTFFYPSASLSLVLNEMITMPDWITYAKLRSSYANVKGGLTWNTIGITPHSGYPLSYGTEYQSPYDGPSYENSAVYTLTAGYEGEYEARYTNDIYAPGLEPETSEMYDFGADLSFANDRIGVDATYFYGTDGPQIYNMPISTATGYNTNVINAVKTRKEGFELGVNLTPVRKKEIQWNIAGNVSTFREYLDEVYGDETQLSKYVKIGDRMDKYYDSKFLRTKSGDIIHDAEGKPIGTPTKQFMGYTLPDYTWAVINNITYKNFALNVQIDGRKGGVIHDYVKRKAYQSGRHIGTTQGKMGEARANDVKQVMSYVGDGVKLSSGEINFDNDGNITNYDELRFEQNDIKTYAQTYAKQYYGSIKEGATIDRSFVKLREVTLTYNLPKTLLQKTNFIKEANVSFVGRNLLYWAEETDMDIDPYSGKETSGGLQTPSTRRLGFNVSMKF